MRLRTLDPAGRPFSPHEKNGEYASRSPLNTTRTSKQQREDHVLLTLTFLNKKTKAPLFQAVVELRPPLHLRRRQQQEDHEDQHLSLRDKTLLASTTSPRTIMAVDHEDVATSTTNAGISGAVSEEEPLDVLGGLSDLWAFAKKQQLETEHDVVAAVVGTSELTPVMRGQQEGPLDPGNMIPSPELLNVLEFDYARSLTMSLKQSDEAINRTRAGAAASAGDRDRTAGSGTQRSSSSTGGPGINVRDFDDGTASSHTQTTLTAGKDQNNYNDALHTSKQFGRKEADLVASLLPSAPLLHTPLRLDFTLTVFSSSMVKKMKQVVICPDCGRTDVTRSSNNFCYYTGQIFCENCFRKPPAGSPLEMSPGSSTDQAQQESFRSVIPGYIAERWDFTKRPVCYVAKMYLEAVFHAGLVDGRKIKDFNNAETSQARTSSSTKPKSKISPEVVKLHQDMLDTFLFSGEEDLQDEGYTSNIVKIDGKASTGSLAAPGAASVLEREKSREIVSSAVSRTQVPIPPPPSPPRAVIPVPPPPPPPPVLQLPVVDEEKEPASGSSFAGGNKTDGMTSIMPPVESSPLRSIGTADHDLSLSRDEDAAVVADAEVDAERIAKELLSVPGTASLPSDDGSFALGNAQQETVVTQPDQDLLQASMTTTSDVNLGKSSTRGQEDELPQPAPRSTLDSILPANYNQFLSSQQSSSFADQLLQATESMMTNVAEVTENLSLKYHIMTDFQHFDEDNTARSQVLWEELNSCLTKVGFGFELLRDLQEVVGFDVYQKVEIHPGLRVGKAGAPAPTLPELDVLPSDVEADGSKMKLQTCHAELQKLAEQADVGLKWDCGCDLRPSNLKRFMDQLQNEQRKIKNEAMSTFALRKRNDKALVQSRASSMNAFEEQPIFYSMHMLEEISRLSDKSLSILQVARRLFAEILKHLAKNEVSSGRLKFGLQNGAWWEVWGGKGVVGETEDGLDDTTSSQLREETTPGADDSHAAAAQLPEESQQHKNSPDLQLSAIKGKERNPFAGPDNDNPLLYYANCGICNAHVCYWNGFHQCENCLAVFHKRCFTVRANGKCPYCAFAGIL
ncbi:unnamed protein product [Amoebophrya sp. A120]|nr:unnamed protein product [Amoebophrya sp. A120]|eukprot:GSA120T00019770001.1